MLVNSHEGNQSEIDQVLCTVRKSKFLLLFLYFFDIVLRAMQLLSTTDVRNPLTGWVSSHVSLTKGLPWADFDL